MEYTRKHLEATEQYQKLNKQYNQMGLLRLTDMLLIIAWYTNSSKPPLY